MGSKNEMTRKDFLTLTFTLVGAAAVGACSSDNNNADGAVGGHGGTTGSAGHGGNGGTGGTAGTGGGGGNAAACADPLPENQSASDHTHTVTIHPSMLDATTAQTFDTSSALAHMHTVTLQPADLTTLKGGGTVMITSSLAGSGPHSHVYTISCH
jgi:hypothetical protein